MKLSKSDKDYMEAIYILNNRLGTVRCVDVANYTEHSKPSITRAVSNLLEKGLVQKTDNELSFTDLGQQVAEQIAERHCILTHALQEIGIDKATAVNDARSMERVISEEVINLTAAAIHCQKRFGGFCPMYAKVGA